MVKKKARLQRLVTKYEKKQNQLFKTPLQYPDGNYDQGENEESLMEMEENNSENFENLNLSFLLNFG